MSSVIEEEAVEQRETPAATPAMSKAGRAAELTLSEVISRPEDLPFDRITRQRLLVAQAAADTIERLSENGAWERLEPAIAQHLMSQARLLVEHVDGLSRARPVRASEPALLLLRRLQRRLEIAAELVADEDERRAAAGPGGLFLGDFTEAEPEVRERTGQPGQKPGTKASPKASGAKSVAKVATAAWRSKTEKLATLRQSRRIVTYVGGGFLVVVASLGFRLVSTLQEHPTQPIPPPVAFEAGAYLHDLQIFVPATFTAQLGSEVSVVVSKDWLLAPADKRREDIAGAAVFLQNRNIRKARFQWEDGTPIVQYDEGVARWFDGPVQGKKKAKPAASTPAP
jgi:hypothetical protein